MDRFTALIKAYIASNLPPPPTPPEEVERRRQMAEELERLQKAEEERERLAKLKETDPEAYEREVNPKAGLYYWNAAKFDYIIQVFCHLVNYHALKAICNNAGCGSHQSTQHLTLRYEDNLNMRQQLGRHQIFWQMWTHSTTFLKILHRHLKCLKHTDSTSSAITLSPLFSEQGSGGSEGRLPARVDGGVAARVHDPRAVSPGQPRAGRPGAARLPLRQGRHHQGIRWAGGCGGNT